MAPWSCWSEWATGTNGMGTALEAPGPVLISGPEHWCEGFHEWVCAGVAVRDPVTHDAVAVLDVSAWRANLPPQAAGWLSKAVGGARAILRQRAHDSGAELAAAFAQTRARSGQALAALDASGKVVIADEGASLFLGVPARVPALDPTVRWQPSLNLERLARSRHQAGASRPRLGRLDADRDRAQQRAVPDHPAPGLPRRPARSGRSPSSDPRTATRSSTSGPSPG